MTIETGLLRRIISFPYGPRSQVNVYHVSLTGSGSTTASTSGTKTIVPAAAAGVFRDIIYLHATNRATVTMVEIFDGAAKRFGGNMNVNKDIVIGPNIIVPQTTPATAWLARTSATGGFVTQFLIVTVDSNG